MRSQHKPLPHKQHPHVQRLKSNFVHAAPHLAQRSYWSTECSLHRVSFTLAMPILASVHIEYALQLTSHRTPLDIINTSGIYADSLCTNENGLSVTKKQLPATHRHLPAKHDWLSHFYISQKACHA